MGSYGAVLLTTVPKVVVIGLRRVPVRTITRSSDVRVGWLTGTAATMAVLLSRDKTIVEVFIFAVLLLCEVGLLSFVPFDWVEVVEEVWEKEEFLFLR